MVAPKIFLFGLDEAGKTSLSTFIKSEEVTDPRPTLGLSIDKWVLDSVEFQTWDVPGQLNLRYLWTSAFLKARLLLFVLDINDRARYIEAKRELDKVLADYETNGIPLIFCFHKMDLPHSSEYFIEARGIFKLPQINNRAVEVFQTSIKSGLGIDELKAKIVAMIQESRW